MNDLPHETTMPYEIVIGLEVHVQLKTESKLFCGCSTEFGNAPNTQTCPICTGMPGTLPVLNRQALQLAIKTGLALHCQISRFTKWDRKNYFYPDLPKGYQISQFDLPICGPGYLEISDPRNRFPSKRVRLVRAHLEEDAGKSVHDEEAGAADTKIDLNRTGTPLLEIVSEPDLRSPLEAKTYLTELKLLLQYLDVSDCNMQEGSLRADANVNLHIAAEDGKKIATPIVEIKNLNSFRAVERAIQFEAERQYKVWQQDGATLHDRPKQTRGWNDVGQRTVLQREKEESADYRYFPDPDLVPVTLEIAQVEAVQNEMAETPSAVRSRLANNWSIGEDDANVIVNQGPALVDYFESVAEKTGEGKLAANWVQQNVMQVLNDREVEIGDFPIESDRLSDLINRIKANELDNSRAKDVFQHMLEKAATVEQIMKELGIEAVGEGDLEALCRELIAENPAAVEDFRAGKKQAIGPLIGNAKKKNPNANPGQVRSLLIQLIEE